MKIDDLKSLVIDSLEDMKAREIKILDVSKTSSFTDFMIICSGGSGRQVKAIAGELIKRSKEAENPPIGIEGEKAAEWVLVDLGDIVIHIMQQGSRDFYQLEKLWDPELLEDQQQEG